MTLARWEALIEAHAAPVEHAAAAVAVAPKPNTQHPKPSVKRFLATIRGGQGLGNCLCMVPALKALATLGTVDLLMAPGYHALFERASWLDACVDDPAKLPRTPAEYDAVIPIGYFPGVQHMPDLTNIVPQARIDKYGEHESDANLKRVRALGYEGDAPDMALPRPSRSPLCGEGRYVVLGDCCRPGGEWERKRWPHFEQFADALAALGETVVFVGHAAESRPYMDRHVNLCGKTDVPALAAVLAHAALYVGNDNGPGHLAAAYGVDTLTLFGPTSVTKNRPGGIRADILVAPVDCVGCQARPKDWKQCTDWRCLRAITPQDVIDKLRAGGALRRQP